MPIEMILGISVSVILGLPLIATFIWLTFSPNSLTRPSQPDQTDLPGRKDTWFLPTDRTE